MKTIIVFAPGERDFRSLGRFLDVADPDRFAGLYVSHFGAALVTGDAGTDALVVTLVHETAHAFAHGGYGTAGMFWAIEGYAELLKRRHSIEAGIRGAEDQYRAFLSMHRKGQTLSIGQVISITQSTHADLDETGCFCFEVFATVLTAYLLDERTPSTALHRLWRRAIVKGFKSADGFARMLRRYTGMTLPELEKKVVGRLERSRSDAGDREIGWTKQVHKSSET